MWKSANGPRALGRLVIAVFACIPLGVVGSSAHAGAQPAQAQEDPTITIHGLDLHDGQIIQQGGTYYFYGTMYAPDDTDSNCTQPFVWRDAASQWCGFGVSTAQSLKGPWSAPTVLISNTTEDYAIDQPFEQACMGRDGTFALPNGEGCFEPRMYHQTWGNQKWTLWFNVPNNETYRKETGVFQISCAGPAGPCDPQEWSIPTYSGGCADEATGLEVVARGHTAILFCATIDQTLAETELGGDGISASDLGGLTSVESPGVYYDHVLKAWVLTYSDPNCGYCAGTGTGFATHSATNLTGDDAWAVLANTGGAGTGQLDASTSNCGGQPGGVDILGGRAYEQVDLWAGTSWGEAGSPTRLEPLGNPPATAVQYPCPSVRLSGNELRDAVAKGVDGPQSLPSANEAEGRA